MQFKIEREQLLKPLQLINSVVERRQTLPILGNILLVVKANTLFLTGTDLEVELSEEVPLQSVETEGEITVPARKLFDICRSLAEDSVIQFKLEDYKAFITAGRSRFSLLTLPAAEFPKVKEFADGVEFILNVGQLKLLIERTQFAMAQQDVRYYLNGSLWQISSGRLTAVATDGHRLSVAKIDVSEAENDAQIIVPRKAILEIMRIIQEMEDTIKIVIGANHVRIARDNCILTSKLIDGRFPEYNKVIPRGGEDLLTLDRDSLKAVLQRVAILSNEKYRGVRLILEKDVLKVMANNPEHEEAEEVVAVNYQGSVMEIGLNVNYLLDILNVMPKGDIVFTFSGVGKSILVEHAKDNTAIESLNVIMPMRL